MKQMDLPTMAGLVCIGLLTWNVSTTQKLAVEIAAFKADIISRVSRLELSTERLQDRFNTERP